MDTPRSKLAVRDYLRKVDNEDAWTEMQGYVYGARMDDAEAYAGVVEFMRLAKKRGATLAIVSHKTKHPFLGPQYDLHAAAKLWVDSFLGCGADCLVDPEMVFFELTKEEKIRRIADIGCDYFIDDLPEILRFPTFPSQTVRLLFDPENSHSMEESVSKLASWQEISAYFEERWTR